MWELLFELLIWTIPQSTGHVLVAIFTLGRVKATEGWAEAIGIAFWVLVFVIVAFLILK